MSSNDQLAAALQVISNQLDLDAAAIQKEVNDLADAVKATSNTSPTVDALIASLTAKAAALGSIVPTAAVANQVPVPAPAPAATPAVSPDMTTPSA